MTDQPTDGFDPLVLPAMAVRWHCGTEDGPSLTVEWRTPPSMEDVAFLVEKLVKLGEPRVYPAYKLTVSGDGVQQWAKDHVEFDGLPDVTVKLGGVFDDGKESGRG